MCTGKQEKREKLKREWFLKTTECGGDFKVDHEVKVLYLSLGNNRGKMHGEEEHRNAMYWLDNDGWGKMQNVRNELLKEAIGCQIHREKIN